MSVIEVLALAVAGGVGAVARFMLDGAVRGKLRGHLPVGTMVINISGSLLLGVVTGFVLAAALPPAWTLVAGAGFLGGYTTFSTASSETVRLLQAGRTGHAVLSGAGTAVLALAAAGAGLAAGFALA